MTHPAEALTRLMDGNRRYVSGSRVFPNQTVERRRELIELQRPVAALLACSDSRVAPELVFDQGIGDLFVVRVAGNIIDDATSASLEFAVRYLGVPLILVLGHTGCGAVQAAVDGGPYEGSLARLVARILPAVEAARSRPGPLLENAVRSNVELVVEQLRSLAPILAAAVAGGSVHVVGAVYDLADGTVTLLEPG